MTRETSGTGIGRRTLLCGGLTGVAALGGCHLIRNHRLAPLPPVDGSCPMPEAPKLWQHIERLNAFGPRLTASPAHQCAVDYIATELEALGFSAQRQTHRIQRWTPKRTSLTLDNGTAIPVAAPYPYSGRTSSAGISGELVWFDEPPKDFSKARDRIAVLPVKPFDLTRFKAWMMFERKSRLPDGNSDFAEGEALPLLGPLTTIFLPRARAAGVRGVICLFDGMSEELARGQVLPFTTPYADIPALWVASDQEALLRDAGGGGRSATLVLDAALKMAETDSIHAVLPGRVRDETIIINTHTDGPNACEENGAAGLLALAQAHLQRKERRRSIVFVFSTGHFQIPQIVKGHGQATLAWLQRHQELWDGKEGHARAVAGLTLEHLGCLEWKDHGQVQRPQPTGRLEREIVYTTNPVMEQIYRASVQGRSKLRSLTVAPRLSSVFLGEGAPLYQCGIPSISLVPGPDYLCQELPNGCIDRIDPDFAYQQVSSFSKALTILDALTAEQIGNISPSVNQIGRQVRGLLGL